MTEVAFTRPNPPQWIVTAQVTDQVETNAAGRVITGVLVYFTTDQGNDGVVFVANAHYNRKTVKARVHAQANLIDSVGNLASDTHV